MFILRKTVTSGVEVYQDIKDIYAVITKYNSPVLFEDMFLKHHGRSYNQCPDSTCYGYLITDTDTPLFEGNKYHILTETGKTFADITCR